MRSGRLSQVALTVFAGLSVAASATCAYAWFDVRGAGASAVGTGSARDVTLSPGTSGPDLYPGAAAPVTVQVANSDAGPVRIVSLSLDTSRGTGGFAVDGGHSGCPLSGLSFVASDNGGSGWTVPPEGSLTISLAGALRADSTLASSCQGAVLTVYLEAS